MPHLVQPVVDESSQSLNAEANWKKELVEAITSPSDLIQRLGLSHLSDEINLTPNFRCLVTKSYLQKIRYGDINDPLLKQVLPLQIEQNIKIQAAAISDPVGDIDATVTPGLLHKYQGRALMVTTGACAIHCRYCFRQHFPYPDASLSNKNSDAIVDYLSANKTINEIILSGGDPLVMNDAKLIRLIERLEAIQQLTTLRIHTRLPIVLPGRINQTLINCFQQSRFTVVMVIHANHANELQQTEERKLKQLHQAGVVLLNQSVLLKGVNDTTEALATLSQRLIACNTTPYYLHLLDKVQGAMHFDVDEANATHLIEELQNRLPGYLVPKLVREITGNKSKTAIFHI